MIMRIEWTRWRQFRFSEGQELESKHVSSISCWLVHPWRIETQVSDSLQPPSHCIPAGDRTDTTLQLQDTPPQQQNVLCCNPPIDSPRSLFSGALCDMASMSSTDLIKAVSKTVTPYFHFRITREAKSTASVMVTPFWTPQNHRISQVGTMPSPQCYLRVCIQYRRLLF